MKLSINIDDDADLRAFIKDQVRGAVKSITREEILAMVHAEIAGDIKGTTQSRIDSLIASTVSAEVRAKLTGQWGRDGELVRVVREETKAGLAAHFRAL